MAARPSEPVGEALGHLEHPLLHPELGGEGVDPVDDLGRQRAAARSAHSSMTCTPRVRNCSSRAGQALGELARRHRHVVPSTSTGWSVMAGKSASISTRCTSVSPLGGRHRGGHADRGELGLGGIGTGVETLAGVGHRDGHRNPPQVQSCRTTPPMLGIWLVE